MTKPFELKAKTKYEVTCSFIDKHQYMGMTAYSKKYRESFPNREVHPFLRLKLFTHWLNKKYFPVWSGCNYEFYLELSTPQKLGDRCYPRLHLHGIVSFDTEEELFLFKLNNMVHLGDYGNIQFNEYRPRIWLDYITKDYKKIKEVIKNKFNPELKIHYKSIHRETINFSQ